MKMYLLLPFLAVFAGALIPVQAAANASLSHSIGSVVYAALLLFVVGLLFIVGFVVVNQLPVPEISTFLSAPAYSYVGGLIVGIYVLSITFLAPRMGVGNAICFIVTGQIIAAVVIDHFALLGSAGSSLTFQRGAGVVLMVIGLFFSKSN